MADKQQRTRGKLPPKSKKDLKEKRKKKRAKSQRKGT